MEELFSYFQPTCLKWGWEAAEVLIQVWDQYSVRIFKLFWLFYLYGMKLLKSFLRKLSKEKCQLHQVLHLRVRSGWQSPKGLLNSAKYWRGTKTMIQCKIRSNINNNRHNESYTVWDWQALNKMSARTQFYDSDCIVRMFNLWMQIFTIVIVVLDREETVVFRE